ncbi:MAG: murein biosynthesis integral membrane protein MurJ [Candidatus Omnitrophica bacterium]|nr:murein biosynthesis integral membrane protein MurJ [Candidatus Omnitrophota bacterium]
MSINKFEPAKPKVRERWNLSFLKGKDSFRSIMRSTFSMAVATLISRILGFVRDVVLAKMLGTGFQADAFYTGFKIPNLFRSLVGEGAMNSAVVPTLSGYVEKRNRATFWNFVSVFLKVMMIVLIVLTLAGIIFSPALVRIMVPGFVSDPVKFKMTIHLTQIMFPYLLMTGIMAYFMAVLFTFRSFWVPMFSPTYLNISMIAGALICSGRMKEPVYGIAIAVVLGGIWQVIAHFPALKAAGFRYKKPKTMNHPGVIKIGKLLIPRVIGSGVYQLSIVIDSFCASLSTIVGMGGVSAIYYANRIVQFPMGLFGVALASAVLPSLSLLVSRNDMDSFRKTLAFSLENMYFVMAPMAVLIMVLAFPITRILFQRGLFDAYSTHITAWALCFSALGLFTFGGIKILVSAFHALADTKTPVWVAFWCLVINTILNFVLMYPFKVGGIALASSIAGTVDFAVLFLVLRKRLGGLKSDLRWYWIKVTFVCILQGYLVWWLWKEWTLPWPWVKLFAVIAIGAIFYQAACMLFKVQSAQKVWSTLIRKMTSNNVAV